MKRLLLVFVACATVAFADSYRFVAVTKSANSPYWNIVKSGVEKAQAELKAKGTNVTVEWIAPESEADYATQVRMVEDAAKSKPQGIILAPSDARALSAPVAAATKAGVPVVVIDSALTASGQISFIATDNYNGGVLAAYRMAALLKGKGTVALFRSYKGSGATQGREQGFVDTLQHFPGLHLVKQNFYAGGTYAGAEKNAADMLAACGKSLDGIFACNDIANHGALNALRKAGEADGKVKLVGFDASAETIAALRSGDEQGTMVQNPARMGYLAVMSLIAKAHNEAVSAVVDTGCTPVTPQNINTPAVAELIAH